MEYHNLDRDDVVKPGDQHLLITGAWCDCSQFVGAKILEGNGQWRRPAINNSDTQEKERVENS